MQDAIYLESAESCGYVYPQAMQSSYGTYYCRSGPEAKHVSIIMHAS